MKEKIPHDQGSPGHEHPGKGDEHYFGSYASDKAPPYADHRFEHACFRVPKEAYCPPLAASGYLELDDLAEAAVHARIDHRLMSADQRQRFLGAYQQLINSGFLGPLVDIHSNATHRMHGQTGVPGLRFLSWHRVYLLKLEDALRSLDASIVLPYWKWSEDQRFPDWMASFAPTVRLRSGQHTVQRMPGVLTPRLPAAADVSRVTANNDYPTFTRDLERIHNTVHVWVGGSMGSVPTAPADPVFWMHHAEIDRIWARWQTSHTSADPNLVGRDAVLDPWPETAESVRDTSDLGYIYA